MTAAAMKAVEIKPRSTGPMARDAVPQSSAVDAALDQLRSGGMAIVVTGEASCRIGHLVLGAGHATADAVNFMAMYGRGVISLVILQRDLDRLQLPMQRRGEGPEGRPAPISIEAHSGISTGISAADRARTIQVASDPASAPEDIVSPGHIFPLLAMEDGVFSLPGPAEMAADLSRLAGQSGTAVICAVLDDRGDQAGFDRLETISSDFELPLVSDRMLLDYRRRFDRQLECVSDLPLTTETGAALRAIVFRSRCQDLDALALVLGRSNSAGPPQVRVQQGISLPDYLQCKPHSGGLRDTLSEIESKGHGVVVILGDNAGRGISGLLWDNPDLAISYAGWGLAARVLGELGYHKAQVPDPSEGGEAGLAIFGLELAAMNPGRDPSFGQ